MLTPLRALPGAPLPAPDGAGKETPTTTATAHTSGRGRRVTCCETSTSGKVWTERAGPTFSMPMKSDAGALPSRCRRVVIAV